MDDPLKYLDKLATRARQEQAPAGDVSDGVIEELSRTRPGLARPMVVFAAGYATIALVVTGYGLSLLHAMNDPMSLLFMAARSVLP